MGTKNNDVQGRVVDITGGATGIGAAIAQRYAEDGATVVAVAEIVVVSSLAGLFAGPSVAGYAVGKHALIGLTRSRVRDYSRKGVRVNAVCPGWACTPMADAEMDGFAEPASEISDRAAGYAAVKQSAAWAPNRTSRDLLDHVVLGLVPIVIHDRIDARRRRRRPHGGPADGRV